MSSSSFSDPPSAGEPDPVGSAESAAAPDSVAPRHEPRGMVPARERRRSAVERVFVRLVATGGIVGIAVALGAILVDQDVAGWIVGLVIGLTSVILAAVLWSSRQL
jgi:protein-S-isoprenylcysteine O-methyltransferase Ste14